MKIVDREFDILERGRGTTRPEMEMEENDDDGAREGERAGESDVLAWTKGARLKTKALRGPRRRDPDLIPPDPDPTRDGASGFECKSGWHRIEVSQV